ncbi:chromosome partitioning protein [Micromonospora sp. CPCC 205711]|uniref:MinD/ParA family ATP-binding protein n=1 Tax=Micromonospora sp. CPCC 205547 TaxID=3122400 RepID=UPI002FF3798C
MVDENADRARLPGQQPVPERDIEPLWPDPTDPGPTGPVWAAHQSAAYPSLTAGVDPTPEADGWSPPAPDLGGQPDTAPRPGGQPESAPDLGGQPGTAPGQGGEPAPGLVPALRVGQPAPVNLDLPFTLDQAIGAPPPVDPPALVSPPGTVGHGTPQSAAPGPPPGTAEQDAPQSAAPGTPVVAGGRGESPWAQPPQRTSAGTEEAVGSAAVPGTGTPTPTPPRLGPFPPSPGTPLNPPGPHPPTEYPPGPTLSIPAPQPGPAAHSGPAAHTGPNTHTGPAGHAGPTQHAGPATHNGQPMPPASVTGPPQPSAGWPGTPWPPAGAPQQRYPQQPEPAPAAFPEPAWTPEGGVAPTAEDFARRRQIRPADPVATMGVRAVVNRMGLVKLPPGRHEQELRQDIEMVRRNFGGLRQVTVVNPKGGAGKTVAILLLAMTFGQKRGGYVLAWDNNETQGTLGMRAQQDFHSRTVRDMLRDLGQFQGAHGRIGDLSQYVRSQGEGMFDVLASDESATGGEMLTAAAFAEIREVVSRFYKLIFVDTGNNVRAQNWQAAMDATDQLVVTMSARNDSAETAARMLDHLEQSGRQRLVRQAVTVVSMPPSRKEIDLPAIQEHFAARTRAVLLAPYERLIDTGEPIRYGGLSSATRDAWLKIAAAVAEGL